MKDFDLSARFVRFLRLVAVSGFGIGLGFSIMYFQPHVRVYAQPEATMPVEQLEPVAISMPSYDWRRLSLPQEPGIMHRWSNVQRLIRNDISFAVFWMGNQSSLLSRLQLGDELTVEAKNNGTYNLVLIQLDELNSLDDLPRLSGPASLHQVVLIGWVQGELVAAVFRG